jgi:hypothetical protein
MTASMTADPIARIFRSPFQARSFTNLVYLLLSFPLGLAYFVFLVTALSLGIGLSITIVGLPLLGLTFLASWGLTALERRMAISLLGAEVPPMGPLGSGGQGFWADVRQLFSNPVTWTGMLYLLLIKFPLGVITFVAVTFLVTLSLSFLMMPFIYPLSFLEMDGPMLWWVDTPAEAGLCFVIGLVLTFLTLYLLNGMAWIWRQLSVAMLGNQRFAAAPPAPPAPAVEEAPPADHAPVLES